MKRILIFLLLCPFIVLTLRSSSNDRGTASLTLKGKTITVDYGRPELRGRDMLARARPGMVWRLGMNRATTLSTAADLSFDDKLVPKGEYSLFARKLGRRDWVLLVNSKTGLWGTSGYDPSHDVAEVPLRFGTREESTDQLTILLEARGETSADLAVRWGQMELSTGFQIAD